MRHRALPIHELFKRAMAQSLMALDTISCWCLGRWWADGCLRHHNRMQTQTEKWRFEAYTTKRISPSPDGFADLCITPAHFNSEEKVEAEAGDAGCFWFLFSSKEVRLNFFTNRDIGDSLAAGMVAWSIGDLPRHATILLQFLKSSTFIYSVFAYLYMFFWLFVDCFCMFLHLACATFHSCTKYSIHLNTRLLDTMQDSGLHVSCF